MSLLDNAMEEFYIMNKTKTPDGYGGFTTAYQQSTNTFNGAVVFDSSIEARRAQAEGVHSVYTITTHKSVTLEYHDVIKRKSDGKIFRITSDGDDKFTPDTSSLNMRQVTAEEWELLTNG